jgi:hypothetical protein
LRLEEHAHGRRLARDWFPELLVREDWEDMTDRDLVFDFHDWQAARLLTHSDLAPATRDRLERAACRQAEQLYAVRALLPEVVNADLIKTALVEALIRRAARPAAMSA